MTDTPEPAAGPFATERFQRTNRYDSAWILENQMGPNALWLTEWLCEDMTLEPGMRVLDLGCGRAMSSIFLAREFGVRVWANDLWIEAGENWERIKAMGVGSLVCPIHAEAHALPYAEAFFDAIISIDAYHYFGTDDLYLNYILKFLKPGGYFGMVCPGLMKPFESDVPEYLTRKQKSGGIFWDRSECFSFHTVDWWRQHWQQTHLVDISKADTLEDGWQYWLQQDRAVEDAGGWIFPSDEEVLLADSGEYLGFVRLMATRRG